MKLLTVVLMTLLALPSFGQITFGTAQQYSKAKVFKKINDNYHNNILSENPEAGFGQCQKDHATILSQVRSSHIKVLRVLLKKVERLDRTGDYRSFAKSAINREVLKHIMQFMIVNEMHKELKSKNLKEIVTGVLSQDPKKRYKKVFEMKYHNVDIDAYLDHALHAANTQFNDTISDDLVEKVKAGIIGEMSKQLKGNANKVLINGIAVQFLNRIASGVIGQAINAGLARTTVSFAANAVISVGEGIVIELLTFPLKGSRPSSESLWLDLLTQYPGILINPELMAEAGIHDNPWTTHCNTINRKPFSIETMLSKLQSNINKEAGQKFLDIDDITSNPFGNPKSIAIDNTFVARKPIAVKKIK